MVTRRLGLFRIKVWVTALGKLLSPAGVVAEGEGNLEESEDGANEYYFQPETICSSTSFFHISSEE